VAVRAVMSYHDTVMGGVDFFSSVGYNDVSEAHRYSRQGH
jgi:hypothetical protein